MEPTTLKRAGAADSRHIQRSPGWRPVRRASGASSDAAPREAADALVSSLVEDHGKAMLATARRYSLCADDAHDAWHRSIEILLRRAATLDPATAHSWLRTVVKHEALAVRAERAKFVGHDEYDPDAHDGGGDPAEGAERLERLAAAAEAMQRLKPNETEALLLLASGMSYREIGEAKGWTYTKVNRLLTEGRQAFRLRVESIESGAECGRWRTTLTRIADREASPVEIAAVEPHLSRCGGCRALLRSDREATQAMALVLPGLMTATDAPDDVPHRVWGSVGRALSDLMLAIGLRFQGMAEAAASTKVVAVAASTAAIAGGGVAIEQAARPAHSGSRPVASVEAEQTGSHRLGDPQPERGSVAPDSAEVGLGRGSGSRGTRPESKVSSNHAEPGSAGEFDPLATSAPTATHPEPSSAAPSAADVPPVAPQAAAHRQRSRTALTPHATPTPSAKDSTTQQTPEFGP